MNKIEIIADYNGVRPAAKNKKPETFIKLVLNGDIIDVEYADGWPLGLQAMLIKVKNGQASKLILNSVGPYSMRDEWEDGTPYIEPLDDRNR